MTDRDTILFDFTCAACDAGVPTAALLDDYCRRYPWLADDLVTFAIELAIDLVCFPE